MTHKKIVLCITGSIAAYKAAHLTRLLIKSGAEVRVLMTPAATQFITPLTLSTLSKHPVHTEVTAGDSWNNHVELGLWADAILVAPATATTLAKMAQGICDSMVVATYLSAKCPVFVAPAMDLDMWKHPATLHNLDRLRSYGNHVIPVGHGELASGLVGDGRMAEPEDILAYLEAYFGAPATALTGKHVLITAGPTYEDLDPVRFLGNRSTGRMGIRIAEAACQHGATVTLLLGPTSLQPLPHPALTVIAVRSAQQMYEAASAHYPQADVAILAAAVADYTPAQVAPQKLKKQPGDMHIALRRTVDIAATLGQHKQPHQINVGFALETHDETAQAQGKLQRKNFDFIVLNSLNDPGAGFQHDTNKVTLIDAQGSTPLPLQSKAEVAQAILNKVHQILSK